MKMERITDSGGNRMDFLLCIVQYLVIMVILAGIGVLGGFFVFILRKKKDAKEEHIQ